MGRGGTATCFMAGEGGETPPAKGVVQGTTRARFSFTMVEKEIQCHESVL